MEKYKKYWTPFVIVCFVCFFIKPAIPFLLMGVLLSLLSFFAIKLQITLSKKGITAVGTIKSYRTGLKGNQTPTISFTAIDGTQITKEPTISSSTDLSKFRSIKNMIDKEIIVLYNSSNPEEFAIADNKFSNIFIFLFLGIGGLIFIAVALANFLGYLKFDAH